ncbi:MAG: PQQ-dependent sugar dehydrogenase [Bdellovibrionales bacterium]|nr:PQQ-dependent sugar dehydrogenase [Bdellovibrionales bacterium]
MSRQVASLLTLIVTVTVTVTVMVIVSVSSQGAARKVYESAGEKFQLELLTQQKDVVWGFDFLDSDRIIFTERGGALRVLNLKSKLITDMRGAPQVSASGQGGLLDIRVHPSQKSKIFLTYSETSEKGTTTALGVGNVEENSLHNFKKIFSAYEPSQEKVHYGSRIEFDGKGHLWISVGERNERFRAQSLKYHNGKIIRLKEDGSIPEDNPFVRNKDARPEIWSFGHRNPQGLVRNFDSNELWSTELGPKGGDELNLIRAGANYGWPIITYGREYSGFKIGEGSRKEGMEQPIAYWVPSISPSALTFYTGKIFSKWRGQIFIASLSGMHLRRLKLDGSKVLEQEELLKDQFMRIRNLRTGPDGFLYLSTDDGKIARLIPASL